MTWRGAIPWWLVIFRLWLGPVIALFAFRVSEPRIWLGILFLAGPLSDIFDGVLARRFGTATPALRVADSWADIAFYIFVLTAGVAVNWPAIRSRIWLIAAVILLEATRLVLDLVKFGRIASYHSYSARLWGLLLMLAFGVLLGFRHGASLLTVALAWGIVSELEGLAFTVILPKWVHDVKTLTHALAIRRAVEDEEVAAIPAR